MVDMDIFINHQKGSAGEKAALLAVDISPIVNPTYLESPNFTNAKDWVFSQIRSEYKKVSNKKLVKLYSDDLQSHKSGIFSKALLMTSSWQEACIFNIALALRHSINGNEAKAWNALSDASWLAGYGGLQAKSFMHIRIATTDAVKNNSKKASNLRHSRSETTQIKNQIEILWKDWQSLLKINPKSDMCFKNKTAFAYQMLHQFSKLKGAKKQDPEVILRWIRVWEKS